MKDTMMLTQQDMLAAAQEAADNLLSGDKPVFEYRPTGHEQVNARMERMKSIPPNANPFLYDDFSMGTTLVRGWTVMHKGFDREDDPMALPWLYLHNARSGQRIRINLDHVPTAEQVAVQRAAWEAKEAEYERRMTERLEWLTNAVCVTLDGDRNRKWWVIKLDKEAQKIHLCETPDPVNDSEIEVYHIDNVLEIVQ